MTHRTRVNFFLLLLCTVVTSTSCQDKASQSGIKAEPHTETVADFRYRKFPKDSFPNPVGYVNDYENIFTSQEEQSLDSLITKFEKETTIEIAVVTIDTLMLSHSTLFDYTLKLANTWGIGKWDKKNGILIGICSAKKNFRIQNGYGIEPLLSNSATTEIMNTTFFPSYKKGQMFEGTLLGLKAIMNALVTSIDENQK